MADDAQQIFAIQSSLLPRTTELLVSRLPGGPDAFPGANVFSKAWEPALNHNRVLGAGRDSFREETTK